jgi:hypothetical protein
LKLTSGNDLADSVLLATIVIAALLLSPGQPVVAGERSCDEAGTLRSISERTSTKIELVNPWPSSTSIEWIDSAGSSTTYGALAAGERRIQPTYTTHVWVARDSDGRCLSVFVSEGNMETWRMGNSTLNASDYHQLAIEGWKVLVSSELRMRDPQTLARCLEVLSESLRGIVKGVPRAALEKIRHVPIWLEYDDSRNHGGVYHASRAWLIENNMNPAKEKSVQFTKNLATLIATQPMMVLHELAHAYHDQVLSFQDPLIMAAYQRALSSRRYDNVERNNGRHERAYAMTDHTEYFAELSEAYFGVNDFFPFTRAQLASFDPESFDVIAAAWNRP